ncbi:MAG: ABC transporter permease [Actinomycetota bacterium]|nr:ABC transporter permease [Actinomycetota bacterium]
MTAVVVLALRDLWRRWRMMLALGLMVALAVLMVTLLDGYVRSIDVRFRSAQPRLVVQQDSTVGEFAGSRIPVATLDTLRSAGIDDAIAELHAVTGTSGTDAVLIAGVDPARYRELDPYHLLSGRHLRSGEAQRTALVGMALAERLGVSTGGTVRLRGRDFAVVGVFELGTYLDDAAVVPLADAQRLLGWNDDVSLYVVPADGPLAVGDVLPGGLAVAQRGDVALVDEWRPLLALLFASVRLLAVGAVAVLGVALWRLAWLHRLDVGLLRLLGFPRRAVVLFIGAQAVVLVAVAAGVGTLAAVLLAPGLARTTLAVTTGPVIDQQVLLRAALSAGFVFVVAVSVPMVALLRRGVGDLVQRGD